MVQLWFIYGLTTMGPSAPFGVPKTNISTFSIWEGALRFGRCNASLPHGHPPRRRGQGWSWPSMGTPGAFNPGPSSSFLILPSSSFPTSLSLWVCSACQRAPVATHRTAGGLCLGFASAHIAVGQGLQRARVRRVIVPRARAQRARVPKVVVQRTRVQGVTFQRARVQMVIVQKVSVQRVRPGSP